jgi:hypothetical protein
MRIAIAALSVLCCVCALPLSGKAALTPVSPNSWDGWSKRLVGEGGILDILYGWDNLTRVDDRPLAGDQVWQNLNGGATVEAKYACFTQVFGYIPGATGGSFVELFTVTGQGLAGDLTVTPALPPGEDEYTIPDPASMPIFRWADDPNGTNQAPGVWSSRETDNADGRDHMVTWKITGSDQEHQNNLGNYVVAWEDLDFRCSTDRDYNDLVVEVSGAAPVPEASTLMLFGSGLSGLLFFARKKRLIKF